MQRSFLDEIKYRYKTGSVLLKLIYINIGVFAVLKILHIIFYLTDLSQFLELQGRFTSLSWNWLGSTHVLEDLIYRPWSIFTYMFVHEGLWHIAGNMIILFFIGRIFLDFFGPRKLLATYILGGLAGWLLYFISYNVFPIFEGVRGPIWGASASVMAIFFAIAVYQPNYRISFPFIGAVKLIYIALIYLAIDIVAIPSGANVGGHLGHLGGAFYGYLLASQFKQNRDIGMWFEKFLDNLTNLFKGGSKMKVVHKQKRKGKKKARFMTDEEYNAEKIAKQKKVDKILDKISRAGYDSLTKDEKDFLFRYGQE